MVRAKQTSPWAHAIRLGLIGLGGGAAAGAVKSLFDEGADEKRRDKRRERLRELLAQRGPQVVDVPVTRAEAQRIPGMKLAADFLTRPVIEGLGGGLLAALGGYAGWRGVKSLSENSRRKTQKKINKRIQDRISRLLDDDPDEQDMKLAAYLQAAIDHDLPLEKRSSAMRNLLYLVGAAAGVSGIGAYRGMQTSPHAQRVSALRRMPDQLSRPDRRVALRPVIVDEEEEETGTRTGSPATQARW